MISELRINVSPMTPSVIKILEFVRTPIELIYKGDSTGRD